jgi:hypothetical protein
MLANKADGSIINEIGKAARDLLMQALVPGCAP